MFCTEGGKVGIDDFFSLSLVAGVVVVLNGWDRGFGLGGCVERQYRK